jgi:hypothetical protein
MKADVGAPNESVKALFGEKRYELLYGENSAANIKKMNEMFKSKKSKHAPQAQDKK